MTPKERFMKALNLEEPDQVPFADWIDKGIRQKLVEAMGADRMDEGEFAEAIGFDFFFLYDDIAYKKGPMFSPDLLRDFFLPRFQLLADKISIPWAYHSDGDLSLIFEDLLGLGMNCINPIEPPSMDIEKVKELYGHRVALWGNIDLIHTLPYGTVEEVEQEVKERIEKIGKGGGFILGTANSITDFCKVDNILAMSKAVKKYGKYPISF